MLKEDAKALNDFKYPSYVQHIMGDIFSLGFGPFRLDPHSIKLLHFSFVFLLISFS